MQAVFLRLEIGEQEGDLLRHVDPAERRFEFDAVEGDQARSAAHDVARVQVSVTLADASRGTAAGEALFERFDLHHHSLRRTCSLRHAFERHPYLATLL